MNYEKIFTDDKFESEYRYKNRQYYRINVYFCDELFYAPCLFEHQHGKTQEEDFDRTWEVLDTRNETDAIREAIKRIDNYKFSPKESELCHRE